VQFGNIKVLLNVKEYLFEIKKRVELISTLINIICTGISGPKKKFSNFKNYSKKIKTTLIGLTKYFMWQSFWFTATVVTANMGTGNPHSAPVFGLVPVLSGTGGSPIALSYLSQ
jgi:hypothetical protein